MIFFSDSIYSILLKCANKSLCFLRPLTFMFHTKMMRCKEAQTTTTHTTMTITTTNFRLAMILEKNETTTA